jgi:tRNA pseudouridine38-40 synthase
MPTFKLTLAYEGTGFVGWQRQAAGTSVQGAVEAALAELAGSDVTVTGASRTDAGVHALGQVASVILNKEIDERSLLHAMNVRLPAAVRVLSTQRMPPEFHARFDARAKTYRYRIWNDDVVSPFEHPYVWHVPAPRLDIDAMARAARLFEGRRDYAAFQASGASAATTVRTISSAVVTTQAVWQSHARVLAFDVRGDGFLRHMVRAMVGTLVEVGRGQHEPDWVDEVVRSRDRTKVGRTVPPSGLFLMGVEYE